MIVSSIFQDCKEILAYGDETLILSRISDACEVLNAEGNFDALLGYVTITTPTNLITLPRDVEVPLKINIDNHPAFGRDKLYEFTQNGPGNDAERVGWSWEDKGLTPVLAQPSVPEVITMSGNTLDDGAVITVTGRAGVEGRLLTQTFVLGTASAALVFNQIDKVVKPVTLRQVFMVTESGQILASYDTDETEPQYRQIRLSKAAATAYILFRRSHFRVTSQSDTIPIRSKMGLLLMIKSLEAYRREQFDTAKEFKAEAIEKAAKEQNSHDAFIDIANASEDSTMLNLSYNNVDSIIVADIYDAACKILGPIGQEHVFDNISEARAILGRKCQWDSLRGYVDINTDQYHYVTLPRYVEYVIKVNINGRPSRMLNKWQQFIPNNNWFQFHLSGMDWGCCLPFGSWQDDGEVVTIRDVPFAVKIRAIPDLPTDDKKEYRIYGFYRNKPVTSQDTEGNVVDGIPVVIDSTGGTLSDVLIDRITRITKPKTDGFVKLMAQDSLGANEFQIGYHYPDEAEPKYRRIKLPRGCERVRIMYRLRENKITSLTDPIHLKSKTAMLCMLRSLKLLYDGKTQEAEAMEAKATKFLMEEQAINNQSEELTIETDKSFSLARQFLPS